MPNMRVVHSNAADKAVSVVASTTAGSLTVANLKTDYKSEVWRSTATSATLTVTWATAETVGMLALPFCNLTSSSTFRVRCYTATVDATPALDKTVYACQGATQGGVNSYSYGGGSYGVVWFTQGAYQKVVLDISDATNPSGYVEAARLVIGSYWSPTYTAEAGATVGAGDNSKQERTDAGDLCTDRGTVFKTLSFDLNFLTDSDRNVLWDVLRGNGMFKSVYVSLVPESTGDAVGEQIFQVYGRVVKRPSMRYQLLNQYATQLEIEEV